MHHVDDIRNKVSLLGELVRNYKDKKRAWNHIEDRLSEVLEQDSYTIEQFEARKVALLDLYDKWDEAIANFEKSEELLTNHCEEFNGAGSVLHAVIDAYEDMNSSHDEKKAAQEELLMLMMDNVKRDT